MLVYLLFAVGFVLLIKGADWLIEGSADLARRFRIPEIVIGLTVVAFGTSAPELAVNVIASVGGNNGLAIGNVVGSNIANILLILGVAGSIQNLTVKTTTVWREIPFSLFAALILGYMVNDFLVSDASTNMISRADGLVLIALFILFLFYTFHLGKNNLTEELPDEDENRPLWKSIGLLIMGLAGLVIGGEWIVNGAVALARLFGYSESFVGFTIVAIGTSLPELATAVVAVRKGNTDLAIGNVIGSNIFNIFWVLGLSATISPMTFDIRDNFSILLNIGCSAVLFGLLFIGRRHTLQKWQGTLLLFGYLAYISFLTMSGK
ncbi:MAG: calcium/sodium antiporter [Flavobacteriales bacterium]|jgi:cation:H+ antiporter|nr:calcium/sodium antiporter [Flavobacteriales bacterium]